MWPQEGCPPGRHARQAPAPVHGLGAGHACPSLPFHNPPRSFIPCRAAYNLSDFELLRRLGDGSYSQVVLARPKAGGKEVALKIMDKRYLIRWVPGGVLYAPGSRIERPGVGLRAG